MPTETHQPAASEDPEPRRSPSRFRGSRASSQPPDAPVAERTVVDLLRAVQAEEINGQALSGEDRRRTVEHLWAEGYGVSETAQVLGISERTIQRDRRVIREANAIERSPGLVSEVVGNLFRQAESSISRLRRLSRDRETPHAVRVDCEKACWAVSREFVESLQSLGYLPTSAQQVQATVLHTTPPSPAGMLVEVEQLELILRESGIDDEAMQSQLSGARHEIEHLAQATQLQSRLAATSLEVRQAAGIAPEDPRQSQGGLP